MNSHQEIQKEIKDSGEDSIIREFKEIGLSIGTRYEWQQLALDIGKHFNASPPIQSWIFMLCRKFPYKIVQEKFEKSKDRGLRYFLACFRKNK